MPGEILSAAPRAPAAGWYGKLPSLGDFASRRLPRTFLDPWDAWLQRSIARGRAALGARWPGAFLDAPAWRFALLPQLCGPSAWAGVIAPSIDRVGRCFPLTVAVPLRPCPGMLAATLGAHRWFAAVESLARAAIGRGLSGQALDDGLAAIGPPPAAGDDRTAAALADWWRRPDAGPFQARLPDLHALDDLVLAGAEFAFVGAGGPKSLWWSARAPMPLHCFAGLPPADCFAALLAGTGTGVSTGAGAGARNPQ